MSLLTKKKYSFISRGMDKKTFTVVSFKGFEAISKPYRFEILLVSEKTDIDPLAVLQKPATFTIHRDEEDDVDFNGILMQFEETQEFDGHLFFKAILTPKFWWLSLTHHNQVFLDLSVPEIMEHALKDGGLNPGVDFSFNLINSYDPHEYICQYDESHFNFVSRWAEHEGIYYFFEQTPTGEKIIFTDSKMEHKDLLLGKDLIYLPQSGLDALHTKEVVQNFICRHNMLPQKVFLKDYNYLKPSFSIEGMADVDPDGRGENYVYGVHFDTPEEGNRLAKIRAEALICRKSIFHGESSVPFIVPGYTFDLNDHYKDAYNRKYLVSEVTHEGHQTGYLIAGLSKAVQEQKEAMFYSNTFTAIYSDEQFRAEHLSEKPKISGTINAKIDAASSGEYAELDEHGRYKVILPFDRSGRFGGKASAWFRMMQPYAGQNQGMHFPLHKGTEVLLTFIDGNPDRPVIAGAMPNPETASPVTDKNQTSSIIKTGKNKVDNSAGAASWRTDVFNYFTDNFIELDDAKDQEHIYISSPGNFWREAQNRYGEYHAKSPASSLARGTEPKIDDLLDNFDSSTGPYNPTGMLNRHDPDQVQNNFHDDVFKNAHVHVSSLDTVTTQEGNIYDFGGCWNYNLGNCYIENHIDQKAELNKSDYAFDMLDKGGPDWSDWSTVQPDLHGGSSNEIKTLWESKKTNWDNGKIWVEKKFGNSYEYTEGNKISITKGHSQEIVIGGKTIEEKYSANIDKTGIVKRRYYKSASGVSEERKWTKTGFLLSDNYSFTAGDDLEIKNTISHTYGVKSNTSWDHTDSSSFSVKKGTSTSTSIYFGSSASASIKFSASTSFSLNVAAKCDVALSLGAPTIKLSASAAAKVDISADASLFLKISAGAGVGMELTAKPATLTYKATNGKFKWHGPGTKLEKEAALKAKADTIILDALKMKLGSHDLKLITSKIRFESRKLGLKEGFDFHL